MSEQKLVDALMRREMKRKTKRAKYSRKRTNYSRGCEVERNLVNAARLKNQLAFRSAGSHSSIDVLILDEREETIELIQCKRSKTGKFPQVPAPFREGYYLVRFRQVNYQDRKGIIE